MCTRAYNHARSASRVISSRIFVRTYFTCVCVCVCVCVCTNIMLGNCNLNRHGINSWNLTVHPSNVFSLTHTHTCARNNTHTGTHTYKSFITHTVGSTRTIMNTQTQIVLLSTFCPQRQLSCVKNGKRTVRVCVVCVFVYVCECETVQQPFIASDTPLLTLL